MMMFQTVVRTATLSWTLFWQRQLLLTPIRLQVPFPPGSLNYPLRRLLQCLPVPVHRAAAWR